MPRDMFGDVVNPGVKLGSQKWYTVPLSIVAHVVLFAAIIIIPLMAADVLPTPPTMMAFVGAPPPPPPPAAAAARGRAAAESGATARLESQRGTRRGPQGDHSGSAAPTGVGVSGGVEGGIPGGQIGGVVGGLPEAPPPPPPPPPAAPVRVGGHIKTPNKTKDVKPVYPPIAQSARVSGIVIIEATIGADGRVKDAKVLRSIPLLDQAALDAVKQWQFTPTLLNGVPVPVIMTVTVNFTLQ